jgi:hypothetical protein
MSLFLQNFRTQGLNVKNFFSPSPMFHTNKLERLLLPSLNAVAYLKSGVPKGGPPEVYVIQVFLHRRQEVKIS